jgi:signal transduction histidine kinase
MTALAVAGWLLALVGAGGATWLWTQLARHAELVADAGHELRGPLCAARVGLHGLDDAQRAAAVDQELRRAALALDDLIAAGRGRRAGARSELVDIGALLDDDAEAWQPLAAAFGAVLTVEPLRGRAVVRADPARLAQACANLVANAVEHGASPVRVRGRVVAGRVRVEVTDAGPGLPAPVAELIARRRRGAARGRGLAITARIAESFGGRVSAAPSRHGACLVLELPSADAAPWPEPWQSWGPELPPGSPRGGSSEPPLPSPRLPSGTPRGRSPHGPHPFPFGPTRPRER